eukprot:347249-Prymnesium_polylepis.2
MTLLGLGSSHIAIAHTLGGRSLAPHTYRNSADRRVRYPSSRLLCSLYSLGTLANYPPRAKTLGQPFTHPFASKGPSRRPAQIPQLRHMHGVLRNSMM